MQDALKTNAAEPRNQYKRAGASSNATANISVANSGNAAGRLNASPAKSAATGKKASQKELVERLNAPINRKQRGSAVSQGGLR